MFDSGQLRSLWPWIIFTTVVSSAGQLVGRGSARHDSGTEKKDRDKKL